MILSVHVLGLKIEMPVFLRHQIYTELICLIHSFVISNDSEIWNPSSLCHSSILNSFYGIIWDWSKSHFSHKFTIHSHNRHILISTEIQFSRDICFIMKNQMMIWVISKLLSIPFLKSFLIGNVRACLNPNLICADQSSAFRDTAWKGRKELFGNELLNGEQNDSFEENQPHEE